MRLWVVQGQIYDIMKNNVNGIDTVVPHIRNNHIKWNLNTHTTTPPSRCVPGRDSLSVTKPFSTNQHKRRRSSILLMSPFKRIVHTPAMLQRCLL